MIHLPQVSPLLIKIDFTNIMLKEKKNMLFYYLLSRMLSVLMRLISIKTSEAYIYYGNLLITCRGNCNFNIFKIHAEKVSRFAFFFKLLI